MELKCSILIVSYNSHKLLDKCLTAIYSGSHRYSFEIIIIDNHSSDSSVEIIRNNYPEVLLIENGENYFFAKANNIGFEKSSGEYILLLNNDTEVQLDAIDEMIEYLELNQNIAGVCGQLLNFDNTIQIGFNIKKLPNYSLIISEILYLHHIPIIKKLFDSHFCRNVNYQKPQLVEQPAASCILLRSSIIKKIGLFDETLYYFYNDVDLCLRLKNGGYPLMYLPSAKIYHHQNASAKLINSKQWTFHFYSNLLQYVKNHYCLPAVLLVRFVLILSAFEKIILFIILYFLFNGKFKKSCSLGNLNNIKDVLSSFETLIKVALNPVR